MNNQKGFTLIEMLVVVAIIGLLSSVVVVGIGGAREKARDTKRIADLRNIQSYLETQYSTLGGYPDIATAYPASLPRDPITGDKYSFCVPVTVPVTAPQTYVLGTQLENAANRPSDGIAAASIPVGCTLAPVPTTACAIGATDKVYCIKN